MLTLLLSDKTQASVMTTRAKQLRAARQQKLELEEELKEKWAHNLRIGSS